MRAQTFDQGEIGWLAAKRLLLWQRRNRRASAGSFRFDHNHRLALLPCGREVGRKDHVQRRGCGVGSIGGHEAALDRVFHWSRRRYRRDRRRRWVEPGEPHGDRVRTDLAGRARFPAAAKILDVDRVLDAQAGAVVLRTFAHVAREQRRLVFGFTDPPRLEQFARSLHRLPPSRGAEELLGDRNGAHARALRDARARRKLVGTPRRGVRAGVPTSADVRLVKDSATRLGHRSAMSLPNSARKLPRARRRSARLCP